MGRALLGELETNGIILDELLHCVKHQVIQAVLPMIESGQIVKGLRIVLESLLAKVEADEEAGVQKD